MFPRRVPENLAAANAGAWRCQVPPRFSTRLCGVQGWDPGGDDLPDGHGIRCRQDTIHRHDIRVGIGALLEAVVFFAEDLGYIHRFAWNPLPYIAPAWVIEALPGATVLNVVRAGRQVSHATPTRKPNISAIAVYGLWVLLLAWGNGDTTISNSYETPFAFSTAATLHPPRFITQRNQEQSARATCRLVYSRQNKRWRPG